MIRPNSLYKILGLLAIITAIGIRCGEKNLAFPDTPTNLKATIKDDVVTLQWDSVGNADGYNLYIGKYKTNIRSWGEKKEGVSANFQHTKVSLDRNYYYVIAGFNTFGEGESSEMASIILVKEEGEGEGFDEFGAEEEAFAENLNSDDPDFFESDNSNFFDFAEGDLFGDLNNGNALGESLDNSSFDDYSFDLDAGSTGEENTLTYAEIYDDDGQKATLVKWESVDTAVSYNIYWQSQPNVDISNDNTNIESDVTSPFTHTGLTNGTTYYYLITKLDADGEESIISKELSAHIWVFTP